MGQADYSKLKDYLLQARRSPLDLTFERIEQIIGAPLPVSAKRRFWWGAKWADKYPHIRSWVDAGFCAEPSWYRCVRLTKTAQLLGVVGGEGLEPPAFWV
jgi:hypothetical protein